MYSVNYSGLGQESNDVAKEQPVREKRFVKPGDTLAAEERAALVGEGVRMGMREGLSLAAKFGLALGLGVAAIALGGTAVASLVRKARGGA